MTFVLDDAAFLEARAAVDRGEVTAEMYRWLGTVIVVAQATRALAPSAMPNGRWDDPDAVEETLHSWLEDSLLRGGLRQAFDRCQSGRALSRYLETALRNWLISRSRGTSGPRLLERAERLLGELDGEFVAFAKAPGAGDRWWGLSEWPPDTTLYLGSDEQLVSETWALGDFAILRYPSSERSDPVLSTDELRRFLRELLARVGQPLSGRHYALAFKERFHYAYDQATTPLVAVDDPVGDDSPAEEFEVSEAAHLALASLTRRQLVVLVKRADTTLEQLADELEVSRGTIDNEYRRALLKVREVTVTSEHFNRVLEKVEELASRGGDPDD